MEPVNRILALVFAIALGVLAGCNLFRPAVSPSPEVSPCSSQVQIDQRDPEAVLQTVAEAVDAKGCGSATEAYLSAFADSVNDHVAFHATFADEVIALRQQAGLPVPVWNLEAERAFLAKFVTLYDTGYRLTWSQDSSRTDDINLQTGEATLHRRYDIEQVENEETTGWIAAGYADLSMRRVDDERWVIVLWADRIDVRIGAAPADPGRRSIGAWRLETL
jgi:hypothetical protein